jgi:uncharacterized protein DUF5317
VGSPFRRLDARSVRALLWTAGAIAMLAAGFAWLPSARPYEAPWAWVCFIGMCVIDDYLTGSPTAATWSRLPKVGLLAAIIMFRRHPEITMLVVLVSAPLGAALKGQRWSTWITATAHWMIAAVVGAAAFRAVGFADTPHFVAATALLALVYYAAGPLLGWWLQSRLGDAPVGLDVTRQSGWTIPGIAAGILLAMAWRTPALQPAALKLADGTLVADAGIALAAFLGGGPAWLFKAGSRIPERPALVGGAILLIGLIAPLPWAWALPLGLAIAAAGWAIWQRALPVLCCSVGAFCNEAVRAANGGYMPVEGSGLMSGLGAANTYIVATPRTALAFLDDRIHLPAPFPGIASAGDILIAVGLAWLVAAVVARRRSSGRTTPEELATEPAA